MAPNSLLAYSETFTVRTYEIDSRKRMTAPALLNLMHETAMQNVLKLKVSVWDLEPHQLSWVLMRMHLKIKRMPMLSEEITITTCPSGFEKFFTYRDYKLFDAKGDLIAYMSSTWLLMDTESRRMRRIPSFILDFEMPPADQCLPRIQHKIPLFGEVEHQKSYEVNWYDLDFNQHLNNVAFIKWLLQTIDDDMLANAELEELDILYRAECLWKDKVHSDLQQVDQQTFLHRLMRPSDQKELARAQTKWRIG